AYASTLAGSFLSSPLDFLLTAFLVGGLVAVAFFAITTGSPRARRRRPVDTVPALAIYGMEQILAGATAAIVLLVHTALLRDTVAPSPCRCGWSRRTRRPSASSSCSCWPSPRAGGCDAAGTGTSSPSAAGC